MCEYSYMQVCMYTYTNTYLCSLSCLLVLLNFFPLEEASSSYALIYERTVLTEVQQKGFEFEVMRKWNLEKNIKGNL